MKLMLHRPDEEGQLSEYYQRAFESAVELFIVTAFLTVWDTSLKLNANCRSFRIITGRDFGITTKAACKQVMDWLPSRRKAQFMVADRIEGFHPKAVFWRESNGQSFAIVGSSNLTRAAFESNYEANVYFRLSEDQYLMAKKWVKSIETQSVVASEDWLSNYREAPRGRGRNTPNISGSNATTPVTSLVSFSLPHPRGMRRLIAERRDHLTAYQNHRDGLMRLFRQCAEGRISSAQFYDRLPTHWGQEIGDRLQGRGWEMRGKDSDFKVLSQSFVKIIDAAGEDRDDVVVEEIDRLADAAVPSRRAFLSEMLCLRFPADYPVVNKPVAKYLRDVKFRAPRGASEGVRYVHLAKTLRFSLLQNPTYPAQNLAELDAIIWKEYGEGDE